MTRGKQKGFEKEKITIKDKMIDPYYIINEDRQFVVMKEGSTLAEGYYNSLSNALLAVSKNINLKKNKGKTVDLSTFMNLYNDINTKIIKALNL
jgi:hypothetical protein